MDIHSLEAFNVCHFITAMFSYVKFHFMKNFTFGLASNKITLTFYNSLRAPNSTYDQNTNISENFVCDLIFSGRLFKVIAILFRKLLSCIGKR